jgi:hypothetical protein
MSLIMKTVRYILNLPQSAMPHTLAGSSAHAKIEIPARAGLLPAAG